jgi:hypothetical protein
MVPPFDIFRVADGDPIWVEAIATLDAAKARVRELMMDVPCEYLIFSHVTGNKISIKPEEAASSAAAAGDGPA